MKRTSYQLLTLFLLFSLILCIGTQADAAKKNNLSLSAKRVEANQVTLTWTNIHADSYVIYRGDSDSSDDAIELATITNGKTTYIDSTVKINKTYIYEIVGLNAKRKPIKNQSATCHVETSILEPQWADSPYFASTTHSSIRLYVVYNNGILPDGYEIYRVKANKKNWKKIKTIKKQCNEFTYKDTKVQSGESYLYRVKAYWIINGKKKYKSSLITRRYAANNMKHASFSLSVLTPDCTQTSTIDLKITSNKHNGPIVIDRSHAVEDDDPGINTEAYLHYNTTGNQLTEDSIGLKLSEYSFDGKSWKHLEQNENVELLPGGQLFLRFVVYDLDTNQNTTMLYDTKDIQAFACRVITLSYCNIPYQWNIDLKKQTLKLDTSNYTYGKPDDTPFWVHTSSQERKNAIRTYKYLLSGDSINWGDGTLYNPSDCQFALAYLDKDNIPELIMKCDKAPKSQGSYTIYTYVGGLLVYVYTANSLSYYEKKGVIKHSFTNKKGLQQEYEIMDMNIGNCQPFLHVTNDKYYDTRNNKTKITQKQFNKLLKKQVGSTKETLPTTIDNNSENRKKFLK